MKNIGWRERKLLSGTFFDFKTRLSIIYSV